MIVLIKLKKVIKKNQHLKVMVSHNPNDYTDEELKDVYRKDEKYLKGLIEESREKIEEEHKQIEVNEKELKWVQDELKRLYS